MQRNNTVSFFFETIDYDRRLDPFGHELKMQTTTRRKEIINTYIVGNCVEKS